jgi:uncharacterized pyridoxal phosphate-containing UPF0001 family protein
MLIFAGQVDTNKATSVAQFLHTVHTLQTLDDR